MSVQVLVDTSVWVAHFRKGSAKLAQLLGNDGASMHAFVLAEIACGTPPAPRGRTLADLARLRQARQASHAEIMGFIEREGLHGQGCGMVDVHLLASARITPGARLWTLDTHLAALATRLGVAWEGAAA